MDVTCIGQAVVDCITIGIDKSGEKAKARSITLSPGGDALNESIILGRLGYRVRTCCITGPDTAGALIRDTLEKSGADLSEAMVVPGLQSVVADIIVENDGSRSSINAESIRLQDRHIGPSAIHDTRVVSLASMFRAPLDDPAANAALAAAAKQAGAILCVDTKIPVFRKITLEEMKETLALTDYIFPNETEASYFSGIPLTGRETPEDYSAMADAFLAAGVRNVIIKAGTRGCFYKGEQGCFMEPALSVKPVVDTTGAGDNFVSGFIAGLLERKTARECCRFGTACSALSIQAAGAAAGVRSRDQVEEMYRKHYGNGEG